MMLLFLAAHASAASAFNLASTTPGASVVSRSAFSPVMTMREAASRCVCYDRLPCSILLLTGRLESFLRVRRTVLAAAALAAVPTASNAYELKQQEIGKDGLVPWERDQVGRQVERKARERALAAKRVAMFPKTVKAPATNTLVADAEKPIEGIKDLERAIADKLTPSPTLADLDRLGIVAAVAKPSP